MKTQQEIIDMKWNINKKIEFTQREINRVCEESLSYPRLDDLTDRKRQLMAQYNILLEVLK